MSEYLIISVLSMKYLSTSFMVPLTSQYPRVVNQISIVVIVTILLSFRVHGSGVMGFNSFNTVIGGYIKICSMNLRHTESKE